LEGLEFVKPFDIAPKRGRVTTETLMIQVEGLTKYYGPRLAVNQVSFRIGKGEIVGLLGLNGSGKTTVLRVLAGSLLPTAGQIRINGIDLLDEPHAAKRLLSFLPESPPLYPEMTVRSYLEFAGRLKGLRAGEVRNRLPDVAERTGVVNVLDDIVEHLSFGYRQRVGIAMSLIHDPEVLLLDEPASGLDPVQIVEMRRLVRSLKGEHTVIFSSHHLSEISQICDRILVIQNGEIIGEGTEEELSERLSRRLRVRLEVRGPKAEVLDCVRSLSGVDGVDVVQEGESVTVLALDLSEDVREGIVTNVVSRGFGVLEMARTDLELENVFLQLMEKGERPS